MTSQREFTLRRQGDQLLLRFAGDGDEVAVRLVWPRPTTARGAEVSILDAKTRKELVLLREFDGLDHESRALLEDELSTRYILPKIIRVVRTDAHFGNRYWEVETDRGPRRFLMKSPDTNALWTTPDRCILHDVQGNCYEIESFKALDAASRAQAEKVL